MKITRPFLQSLFVTAFLVLASGAAYASDDYTDSARDSGGGVIWVFANLSYAGMRAQNSASTGWRIVAFIFGFPGTLLSFFVVKEGSEKAYGIEMPRKR